MENSDGEGGDPGGEDNVDAAWRLQRLERQRWLQEQVRTRRNGECSLRSISTTRLNAHLKECHREWPSTALQD